MPSKKQIPVVVTTEHRGVFFGHIDPASREETALTIKDAQMCVYWSEGVGGVVGLAATGPDSRCRITRPAPSITAQKVTAVMEATPEAVKAWQSRPWG